jgi:hypothetical protein
VGSKKTTDYLVTASKGTASDHEAAMAGAVLLERAGHQQVPGHRRDGGMSGQAAQVPVVLQGVREPSGVGGPVGLQRGGHGVPLGEEVGELGGQQGGGGVLEETELPPALISRNTHCEVSWSTTKSNAPYPRPSSVINRTISLHGCW